MILIFLNIMQGFMSYKIKKRIPSLLVFFIVLYPKCLDYLPRCIWLIKIIYALQIVLATYFLFDLFVLKDAKLNKKTWVLFGLFTAFNFTYIVSDLNAGVILQTLTINLRRYLIMVGMLVYVEQKNEKRKIELLNSLYYYLSVLMIINVLCYICFPNGIARMSMFSDEGYLTWSDSVGFLDADNRVSLFCLLYFFITNTYVKLRRCNKNKKNRIIILSYTLVVLNIIFSRSGSGIIALVILLICQLLIRYKKIWSTLLSWKGILAISIFIGLFVSGKFSGILVILGTIFNKGSTLSGRTVIWREAIDKIAKAPILGYGTLEGGAFFKVGTYTWYSHNQYLDIWLQGGIICLIILMAIVVFLNKIIKLNCEIDMYRNFICVMVSFLAIGVVEHFILRNYYQFWIFVCVSFALRNVTSGSLFNEE